MDREMPGLVDFACEVLGVSHYNDCRHSLIEVRFLPLLFSDETYSEAPLQPNVGHLLKNRVIGKICPLCGKPGSIVYQTKERIVFECPNGHQFEVKLEKKRDRTPSASRSNGKTLDFM